MQTVHQANNNASSLLNRPFRAPVFSRRWLPPVLKRVPKKTLRSLLATLVLVMGLVAGLVVVRYSTELRKKAEVADDNLSLVVGSVAVEFDQNFTVDVVMNTNTNRVAGITLEMTVDPSLFEIVSLTPGPYFARSGTPYGNLASTTLAAATIDNTVGRATVSLGVACDPCYLGQNPGDGTPPCQATPPPQCYPTSTNGTGIIATLTLRVRHKIGSGQLNFNQANTQIAAVAYSQDVKGQLTSQAMTVSVSCQYIDFVDNNRIDLSDITRISNRFGSRPGDANWDALYDFNQDNVINLTDITQASNRFNLQCN